MIDPDKYIRIKYKQLLAATKQTMRCIEFERYFYPNEETFYLRCLILYRNCR